MKIDVRKTDDVLFVDLKGRLVAGTGDEVLFETMNELAASDWGKIVVNLSEVTRIDSSGIGELVAGIKLAERFGKEVKVLRSQARVHRVLEVGKILPFLDVHDNENAALASFTQG